MANTHQNMHHTEGCLPSDGRHILQVYPGRRTHQGYRRSTRWGHTYTSR